MTAVAYDRAAPQPERDQFLRFVNTLTYDRGRPTEHLPDMPAVLSWLRRERLLSDRVASMERARLGHDPEESDRRIDRFRHLRDVIRAASEEQAATGSISLERVRDLNHILRHGLHYHQLEAGPDHARYGLAKVGDHLDQARATIAGTFAAFLAEDHPDRLRVCANSGCREIFIDRSPTGRRRWCNMRTCGNQAKVAAHRQRHRAPESEGLPAPAPAG